MITEKDFDSIKADGRSLELIKRQYEHLVGGKIKISGIRPAIIGDGILEMDTKETVSYTHLTLPTIYSV